MGVGKSCLVDESCQVETPRKIEIEIFIKQYSKYGQRYTNFRYKNDINDDDYVFAHKLKNLITRLLKFAVCYFRENETIARVLLPGLIKTEHENIYKFDTVCVISPMQGDFLLDMAGLISHLCKKYQGFLMLIENYICEYDTRSATIFNNFDLCDLKIISAKDCEKLLETLNYTKVIPFNMSRCLRNNIRLPKVIQYLAEQLSYDVAEEIASYIYVICIR